METAKALYEKLVKELISRGLTITCMESMTGGFIASCLTDVAGASAIFKGSYVAYSNEEKIRMGVPETVIKQFSVYSKETALSMAEACKKAFKSDIAIGITGNAGNVDPANTMGKPGIVYGALVQGTDCRSFVLQLDAGLERGKMKVQVAKRVAEEVISLINQA